MDGSGSRHHPLCSKESTAQAHMKRIKATVGKLLGRRLYRKLAKAASSFANLLSLTVNTYKDGLLFFRHSMVFRENTFNKIESRIILYYHGLEKGFLHDRFRFRFANSQVRELARLLKSESVVKNHARTQIASAYLAMCKYYEAHETNGIDISDYYSSEDYRFFKQHSSLDCDMIRNHERSQFFADPKCDFAAFAKSRGSVRSYAREMIPLDTINRVVELAKTAPSVCNRQPVRVYYVGDKERVNRILAIQQGLVGYEDEISQLFVVVSDRNYFYSVGERNQLYVDGGIFIMNLLYALHYEGIGACPAHWGHTYQKDEMIKKEISLSDSEKVICMIPFGIPKDHFKTTLSLRRTTDEILRIVS